MQKISLSGGNITAEDQMTYAALIKQLQSISGGSKLVKDMNLVPATEIKDRPFSSSVVGYEGGTLQEKVGTVQNQIANNTKMSSEILGDIYQVLSRREIGTGLGTKSSPIIAGNVPSTRTSGGGTYTTSEGELTDNGKKYIVQQYKLKAGDYFEYKGQRYLVNTGYDAKFIRPSGWATRAASGGYIRKYSTGSGGVIVGPGTGTSDSIPAMLSNGEYVVRAAAVRAIGVPMLDQINKMAMGGLATKYDVSRKMSMPANTMGYNKGWRTCSKCRC
jgi:hypothetical protein